MKRIFIVSILTCVLLALLLPGCTQPPPETPPAEPSPPYTLELSFPNGAPALNQVAELKVVAIHKTGVMNNVRIDVILPEGFELISGNLTWSADSLPYGDTEVINAQIKAIKTGNWTIEARLNEGQSTSYPEGGARHPIYINVSEDSAEWGITPPWYQEGGHDVPVHRIDEPSSPIEVD